MNLMTTLRQSIIEDRFEIFVQNFFLNMYPDKIYPNWCLEALKAVNIELVT